MRRVRIHDDQKRKLPGLAAALGTAAAATVVGVRYYRKKLGEEAARLGDVLNLRPGKVVAEVGTGKGQMTLRVARLVRPGGRVYSTEFEPKKLRQICRSVEKSGLENVSAIKGSETGTELPSQSCDAIFHAWRLPSLYGSPRYDLQPVSGAATWWNACGN